MKEGPIAPAPWLHGEPHVPITYNLSVDRSPVPVLLVHGSCRIHGYLARDRGETVARDRGYLVRDRGVQGSARERLVPK